MKTFRSEVFNGRKVISSSDSTYVLHEVINSVLDRYGDWRVWEGVLRVDTREHLRRPEVVIDADDQWHYWLGESGDRIKLILPPEKKSERTVDLFAALRCPALDAWCDAHPPEEKGLVWSLTKDGADRLIAEARARADRYEAALGEVVAALDRTPPILDCQFLSAWTEGASARAKRAIREARRALKDG